MKILLAHILIILGISKVYAGTSDFIKELAPESKNGTNHEGTGDKPGSGTSRCSR